MNRKSIRIGIGALVWTLILGVVVIHYLPSWFGQDSAAGTSLVRHLFYLDSVKELEFKYADNVQIGDPIFWRDESGELIQVGVIRQVDSPDSQSYDLFYTDWASATFFSSAPEIGANDYVTIHHTPQSMDWVARFLFPPERRQQIARLIAETYARHSREILSELLPILESAWLEASPVIRDEVLASLARHREQFESIGARYRSEIVEEQLVPLVDHEIWPLVRQHTQPLVQDVGEQIWREASIWRFGWRALYDASPLPQRDLTKAEFNRFVDQQAIPVLEENLPRMLNTLRTVLEKIIEDPDVQQVLRNSLVRIRDDKELRALLLTILRESILENEKLRQTLTEFWERPDVQDLLALTDQRLEPTVVQIGEVVFGSPHTGVTPEFARILRNKILLKDNRWFILHHGEAAPAQHQKFIRERTNAILAVIPGESNMENPFYYPARER